MKLIVKYLLSADDLLGMLSLVWINAFSIGRCVLFEGGSSQVKVILHSGKYSIYILQAGLVLCQGYVPEKQRTDQTQNSNLKQCIS